MSQPEAPASFLSLEITDLMSDPVRQFERWFRQALEANLPEPNAMTLATASQDGRPSARIVLLKHFDARGFLFFTNYESQKGRELAENPRAALVFFWPQFGRQIRITGAVTLATREESEEYFRTRPRGSQLGAWASRQSEVIGSRAELEARVQELERQFANQPAPLPPAWGGYRVVPGTIEFWQSRADRLHDRFRYRKTDAGIWRIERLSP